MKIRFLLICLLTAALLAAAAACGSEADSSAAVTPGITAADTPADTAPGNETASLDDTGISQNDAASSLSDAERENMTLEELMENTIKTVITMENGDVIEAELYPDLAPQTVRNFVSLARSGYYDGLKFHRIISGFMIQGGCPDGNGTGNPGYSIKGEFNINGFKNELEHTPGVLSMARTSDNYDSAGSQFFIMHADAPFLDGSYAAFGKVTSGLSVVDDIAQTPVLDNNGTVAPENMPVIKSITIDDDINLPEPEKLT